LHSRSAISVSKNSFHSAKSSLRWPLPRTSSSRIRVYLLCEFALQRKVRPLFCLKPKSTQKYLRYRFSLREERLGFAKSGNGIAQTVHNALLAEYDHGIEERRRNRLPNDCHARRINQQAGFYAARFGNRTRRVVASVVVPFAERFQRIREFREEFRRFRIFPEFGDGRGIAWEIVAEKGARPRRKIRQQPDARPQ